MHSEKTGSAVNTVKAKKAPVKRTTTKSKPQQSKKKTIIRDISWLSFNARVLQEASDTTVPLYERLRFLGIFSNNLDEFFRVRVATLKRMGNVGRAKMHLEENPDEILEGIQNTVISQQQEFQRIWKEIEEEMKAEGIFLLTEKQLNRDQQKYVTNYFNEEVRTQIIPLMIESIPQMPLLRDKSIYLAAVLGKEDNSIRQKYNLIEIPNTVLPRFIILPSKPGEHALILLEDVIRFNLPHIFSYFGYDKFSAHIIKVTRDAELDIDNDVATSLIHQIEKGLKARRKGKPVRFIYDQQIDALLLEYLMRRLGLSGKDNLIPGGRIHNFKDFISFPEQVFTRERARRKTFIHPLFQNAPSVMHVMQQQDVMLHFPYQSFDTIIDLLREAAMDPNVTTIKITAYRLAKNSQIVNALINAVRNGKQVVVVLELRARFDEEANLKWKERLEEEGVKVLFGVPGMKVHAKICVIKKRLGNKTVQFGFVSTGNLNEKTAKIYGDHCLLTTNRNILADVNRIFSYLESPRHDMKLLEACKTLVVSPFNMRKHFIRMIDREIRNKQRKKPASIIIKMNSLSDEELIYKLYDAAKEGVDVKLIIRGICCAYTENKKWKKNMDAISIVDEYLEHARVFIFANGGKGHEKVYIASSDWMVRNLDHRVEAAVGIETPSLKKELIDILNIQLESNVKVRILDNEQNNAYKHVDGKKHRAQLEIFKYLHEKTYL